MAMVRVNRGTHVRGLKGEDEEKHSLGCNRGKGKGPAAGITAGEGSPYLLCWRERIAIGNEIVGSSF